MEVHYFSHRAAKAATDHLLSRAPRDGHAYIEHYSALWSTGVYGRDNQSELLIERTRRIVATIRERVDGELMLWVDPGTAIFGRLDELHELADGYDLLMLGEEDGKAKSPRFSVQLIRRNLETLVFYSRVLLLQLGSNEPLFDDWAANVLRIEGAPRWGFLPLHVACSSLGLLQPTTRIVSFGHEASRTIEGQVDLLAQAGLIMDQMSEEPCGIPPGTPAEPWEKD